MTRAFVGLGSNLGDRLGFLRRAVVLLAGEAEVVRASAVYETDPVGPPQPDFLNAVVEVRTALGPRELLARLKAVERAVGRSPASRWGPREIDLDLLLYGDLQVREEGLVVPHPELHRRAFVLVPLADLDPDLRVPRAGTVRELLAAVGGGGVRRFAGAEALLPGGQRQGRPRRRSSRQRPSKA